jgi:hypothetical protein
MNALKYVERPLRSEKRLVSFEEKGNMKPAVMIHTLRNQARIMHNVGEY